MSWLRRLLVALTAKTDFTDPMSAYWWFREVNPDETDVEPEEED